MSTLNRTMKVPYTRLGSSGLKVSRIILGTMSYGSSEWSDWVIESQEEMNQHIKEAYEAGIQTFDTANVYSNGKSEIMLGNAIKELGLPRDEIVIMTKVFFTVGREKKFVRQPRDDEGYINQNGLSRKHIFDSVKHSLERLQMDYIDVLQCHRFDPDTPIEETMQALHDVVKAGYVRYIGMSSCWAYQFHAMQNYAISNNLTPFISMQNHYSAVYREEEREMFPTLKLFGVGSIPWSPLARGLLTRPLKDKSKTKRGKNDLGDLLDRYQESAGTERIVKAIEEIANNRGISMAQVALAWILSKDYVTAPIIGTTSLANLRDCIDGVNVKLTEEEIRGIEEHYIPQDVLGLM